MDQNGKLDKIIDLLTLSIQKNGLETAHKEEHEYLRLLIDEHKTRKETWLAIQRRVASGTIWAALVGIFSACIVSVKVWISGPL